MTRPALALAALLAAAPALAQTAPPSAADSALVERYLDLSFASAEPAREMLAGAPGPGGAVLDLALDATTRDSVRAAFYADLRPALLAEAVAFTEGPLFARAQRAGAALTDSLSFAEVQAAIDAPGDRPLADPALVARYAAATLAASQPPEAQERVLDAMLEALPPDVVGAAGGADGFRDLFRAMTGAGGARSLQLDVMTRAARLSLAPLSEADALSLVAYTESEAAQYVGRTAAVGAAAALAPRMAEMMAPALAAGAAAPPRPGGAAGADRVFEVAEVQPELVGGLDSLTARVVYPEAARRDGVEGQVVVQFVVDEGGAVADPVVLRSPDARLSEAAVAAVRASRFRPGSFGGEPVRVRFAVPVTFRLAPPDPLDGLLPPVAPGEDGVYERAEVPPRLEGGLGEFNRRLEYPVEARRKGIEGQVLVGFVVGETGGVRDVRVLRPVHPLLDEAAVEAVRRSRFAPGTVGGEPVPVRFALPVTFRLR